MVQLLVAQQKRDCLRFFTTAKKHLPLSIAKAFAGAFQFAIRWSQVLRQFPTPITALDQQVTAQPVQIVASHVENKDNKATPSDASVHDLNQATNTSPWWIHSSMVEAYPDSTGMEQAGAWAVSILGTAAETKADKQQALSQLEAQFENTSEGAGSLNSVAALIGCLKTEMDYSILLSAVFIAGRHRVRSASDTLRDIALGIDVAAFEHPDSKVKGEQADRIRSEAIRMLGFFGDDSAIMPLLGLLNDRNVNYRVRLVAAESLGRLGDSHALAPLLDIIQDERESSLYLKESAAKALGLLGDIRAIEPMIEMLESQKGFRGKFKFLKERLFEAIGQIGSPTPKVTDTLIRGLKDSAPSIRMTAVDALGELGDKSCLEPLMTMVGDSNNDVVLAAVSAIYKIGGEAAIKELLSNENLAKFVREELESYIP